MTNSTASHRLRVGVDVRCLGGGELRGFCRYTLELTKALARRGTLDVIAISDVSIPFCLPVEVRYVSGRREVVREQIGFVRTAVRERVDVLLAPANRGLPWLAPCGTVLTLHDTAEWDPQLVDPPRGKGRVRFTYASLLSLAAADRIITVSRASAVHIHRRLRVPTDRVRVVYEAAPHHFTEAVRSSCASVAPLGLTPGYVLYVGGFDVKKDVATLLRAFSRVLARANDAHLVLAGAATSDRRPLEAQARELGIAANVQWLGFVDDAQLPALYGAAGCFVFPAVAEGFGLPVMEAMSCGTPVVVADAGSLTEVVGDAGIRFEAGDDNSLADAIVRLLHAGEAERQALSASVRARAAEFSWARTAEETELVLREAAAIPAAARWAGRVASLRHSRVRLLPSRR